MLLYPLKFAPILKERLWGGKNLAEQWAATLACRSAIKDGALLDNEAAIDLAKAVLPQAGEAAGSEPRNTPRCPHGRPLWMELGRSELLRAVRR